MLEIDEPDRIQLKSVDDVATFIVTYELTLAADEPGSQHDDIEFRGFGRLLAPFIALAVRSGIERQFEELESKAQKGDMAQAA